CTACFDGANNEFHLDSRIFWLRIFCASCTWMFRTEAASSFIKTPVAACAATSVTVVGLPFQWHGSRYALPAACTQREYLPAGRPWIWNAPSPPDLVFLTNGGAPLRTAITSAAGMGLLVLTS